MEAAIVCSVCRLDVDATDSDAVRDGRRSLCGDCARTRRFDELLEEMDATDGTVDGSID